MPVTIDVSTYDNPIVRTVRHAVSLEERRAYFRHNLWVDPARDGQDSRQVGFPGVHCDVAGGYREADSGLSKTAPRWMPEEIGPRLKFQQTACDAMLPSTNSQDYAAPSATAAIHESLRGLWRIVEYIPKRVNIRQSDGSYKTRWILPRSHPPLGRSHRRTTPQHSRTNPPGPDLSTHESPTGSNLHMSARGYTPGPLFGHLIDQASDRSTGAPTRPSPTTIAELWSSRRELRGISLRCSSITTLPSPDPTDSTEAPVYSGEAFGPAQPPPRIPRKSPILISVP